MALDFNKNKREHSKTYKILRKNYFQPRTLNLANSFKSEGKDIFRYAGSQKIYFAGTLSGSY